MRELSTPEVRVTTPPAPIAPAGYRLLDARGNWIAHGLTAREAYAMAHAAQAHGQARIVELPNGLRRLIEPQTEYARYLAGELDPRD